MKRRASLLLALLLCAWTARAGEAPNARPSNWATPVTGTTVANLYRVESGLYRGAQPNAAGFQELARLGVRTVLDLAGGDGDGPLAGDESLKLFHVPMSAWGLHDDLVLEALRIMTDPENRPLMVHCRHGADRTGAMVALYRVVVQGWSKEKAVREMDDGGYHHSWLWRNLDRYVMNADVAKLRRKLGLPDASLSVVGSAPSAEKAAAASPR
jgi:protein tyrosine phosphatase (PTP) superfamily phosphohydrolase (DUF442 family)